MARELMCVSCSAWSVETDCARCGATKPKDVPQRVVTSIEDGLTPLPPLKEPPTPRKAPEPATVRCGRCNSSQITAHNRGFSFARAATGAILVGPLGLAAGAIGNAKVRVTCVACGHSWQPKG